MKITLERKNDEFLLEARNEKGNVVMMDNRTLPTSQAASPMEVVLMSLAGCSAIDIISILKKKRQQITSYKVTVDAAREKDVVPALFTEIQVTVYLEGQISEEAALHAAELSFNKYCSVSKILEKSAKIFHKVVLNEKEL